MCKENNYWRWLFIKYEKVALVLSLIRITDDQKNGTVCVTRYFYDSANAANEDESCDDPIYEGYKAVLDCKSKDETLVIN